MANNKINERDYNLGAHMDEPVYDDVSAGYYTATILGLNYYDEINELDITLNIGGVPTVHIVTSAYMRHTINALKHQIGGAPSHREFLKKLIGKEVQLYLDYNEGVNSRGKYAIWTNIEYTSKEEREHRLAVEAAEAAKKAIANAPIR